MENRDSARIQRFKFRSCTAKFSFDSRPEAKTAIKRMAAKGGLEGKLKVYRCDFCDKYHIGHKMKSPKPT